MLFRVAGSGEFFYDMLRYDMCFPTREDAIKPQDIEPMLEPWRVVTLESPHRSRPTFRRWESRLWYVVALWERGQWVLTDWAQLNLNDEQCKQALR